MNGITIPLAQRYSLRSIAFVIRVLKVGREKKKDLWVRRMVYWQTTGPSLKASLGQEDEHDDDDDGKFYRIQVHLGCVLYGSDCVLRSTVEVEDLPPRSRFQVVQWKWMNKKSQPVGENRQCLLVEMQFLYCSEDIAG